MEMAIADPAYAHLPEAVEAGAVDRADARRQRAPGARGEAAAGAVRRARTSTRTGPGRCSPTRRTARWRRVAAERSAVLLRNEGDLLPLDAGRLGSIAVIGPLADSRRDTIGPWVLRLRPRRDGDGAARASASGSATASRSTTRPASGRRSGSSRRCSTCSAATRPADPADFDDEAELRAGGRRWRGTADVAVVVVGEWQNMIGEAASRSSLELPGAPARAAAGGRRHRHAGRAAGDERPAARPALGRRARAGDPRHLVSRHPGRRRGRQPALRRRRARAASCRSPGRAPSARCR